jgi:hypothetical protein
VLELKMKKDIIIEVPTYSGVKVSINIDEMARDDGYDSVEEYIYSYIDAGFGDYEFSKSHQLYKKYLDWCELKENEDKDIPDKLWKDSIEGAQREIAKGINSILLEILKGE